MHYTVCALHVVSNAYILQKLFVIGDMGYTYFLVDILNYKQNINKINDNEITKKI